MSQNVSRLKELLFDNEAQAIADLTRRIDTVAEADTRGRDELKKKVDEVFNRAGTVERFTHSVSETLDEALRKAEITRHVELTQSIAPLVVTTIKTELRNSQDEMVEALYPITGRLVKAYVASAIKDLNVEMNRRIEQNPVMLRLQSLTTGRSVAELALAGAQNFELEELFLIRRATGELVAHWSDDAKSGREQMLSGVLAAVNEFANEAFAADQTSMREIDLGDASVYLRGSALYLLAARCIGQPPKGIEQLLDSTFLTAIERQGQIESLPASEAKSAQADLLKAMGRDLMGQIAEQKAEASRPAGNPLKMIALAIGVPLLLWFGWVQYTDYANRRTREIAQDVVTHTADMQGYPARFFASDRGKALTVSGLVPSQSVKQKVLERLAVVLPKTAIREELAIIPGSEIEIPNVEPQLQDLRRSVSGLEGSLNALAVQRASERTERRLRQAEFDLRQAATSPTPNANSKNLAKNADDVAALLKAFSSNRPVFQQTASPDDMKQLTARIAKFAGDIGKAGSNLSVSLGGTKPSASADTGLTNQSGRFAVELAAETMAAEAERLAAMASTISLAGAFKPEPVAVVEPPPRAQLEEWCRAHAIFFGSDAQYRDPGAATKTIEALAAQIIKFKLPLRIVGYTDDAGGQLRNAPLAQDRAERVRQDLISRGVSASLLHAIGRSDARDLSSSQGFSSPNRRVEFEVAFEGEILQ